MYCKNARDHGIDIIVRRGEAGQSGGRKRSCIFHVPWKDKAEMQTNENANTISSDARSAVKDWREIREPS
jgi:hypothetical protein